jgi:hypothetical protein
VEAEEALTTVGCAERLYMDVQRQSTVSWRGEGKLLEPRLGELMRRKGETRRRRANGGRH